MPRTVDTIQNWLQLRGLSVKGAQVNPGPSRGGSLLTTACQKLFMFQILNGALMQEACCFGRGVRQRCRTQTTPQRSWARPRWKQQSRPSDSFRSLPRLIRASLVAAGFVTLRSSERQQRSLLWRFGDATSRLASRWIDNSSCTYFPLLLCFLRALQYVKF